MQAVSRGARRPLLLADMPFGSYEESEQQAVRSAVRILKEANMDAIKVEGLRSRQKKHIHTQRYYVLLFAFMLSLAIRPFLLLFNGMVAAGGSGARLQAAKAIAATGIAVMGHTGLTPQAISSLGGFKPQVGFLSA